MADALRFPLHMGQVDQFFFPPGGFEDFTNFVTANEWTSILTDSGSIAVGDARGGVLTVLAADGSVVDNDQSYLKSTSEVFLFTAGKPFYAAGAIQFTETASGVYNAFFGFANAIAAELLIDDGAGVRASGSVCAIYKLDGGTVWRCVTRNNSVVTDSISLTTAGGSAYQKLEIDVQDMGIGTQQVVTFKVDNKELRDATTGEKIVHRVTVASSTEMNFGFGNKLGASTNNDALLVDWVGATQKR
jgi:hypothetical protein